MKETDKTVTIFIYHKVCELRRKVLLFIEQNILKEVKNKQEKFRLGMNRLSKKTYHRIKKA